MGYGGTALLMHTHVPSKSQRGPNLVGKFQLVRGGGRLSIKIQKKKKKILDTFPWKKVQYQALVKLDCYITAECKTEPKEDGQSMWSAESPKAPQFTRVPFPGQFSARRKKKRVRAG